MVELYKTQHGGKLPHLNPSGGTDDKVRQRLMRETAPSGRIIATGSLGPYLITWPVNSYMEGDPRAGNVKAGNAEVPEPDGTTGWYYSRTTGMLWPNYPTGDDSIIRLVMPGGADAGPLQP